MRFDESKINFQIVLEVLGKLLCIGRDPYILIDDGEPMNFRRLENMNNENDTFDSTDRGDKTRMFKSSARMTSIAEWRRLAAVLDRAFLVLFTIIVTVVSFLHVH